jgi:uncharacterized 2Fe-2S/4Fe-4S cluster protein (DUF4445 family)
MSVQLNINNESVVACEAKSLFEYGESAGVQVPSSCRKQGKCRECMVEVTVGGHLLSARTEAESHLPENFRLSCCTNIIADEGEVTCHTMRRGEMKVETGGMGDSSLASDCELKPAVSIREGFVYIDDTQIEEAGGGIYGLAMDLGTTTCVLRLYDLSTGELVATNSFENPQRFGGSEVMARIQYDCDHKGRLLQRTLLGYMSHAIEAFDVDGDDIYELVVAGNSTMRDLFFGLNVESIGQKPYHSLTQIEMDAGKRDSTVITTTGKKLRLPVNGAARIYGMPLISGHVGADAAACLLAIGLATEEKNVCLMDIGTNTELVLGNKNKIMAASCPAGPAFEGGAIECGMPGLEGAIERVTLNGTNIDTSIIGDTEATGICGSGLIDLMSEFVKLDLVDEYGRYQDGSESFMIDTANNIYLHERDINELAQAKGANVAGLRIILQTFGLEMDEIDTFYLAGGFGRHLSLTAAKRIGLIPDLPDKNIEKIGNASVEGASIALLNITQRATLESMVKNIEHVELETDPGFFDHFVFGCQFIPVSTDDPTGGM